MAQQKQINTQILVLPSWYPNQLDKFAGDFIQRHVKAISALRSQYIIYVVKDEFAKITSDVFIDTHVNELYTEKIIYYHCKKTGIRVLDKLISQLKLNQLYFKAINEYVNINGTPALIHVHVILKAGLIALWASKKWNIPFIISEHWSVFLEEANYKIKDLSILDRLSIKKILRNAVALTTVSDRLGKSISKKYKAPAYTVIPNVVDHTIFFPVDHRKSNSVHFIHASNMVYEKNTESIIKAFGILKKYKFDGVLNLYGPAPESLKILSKELGIDNMVFFRGEVDQIILASAMQQSDALLLYSRFETFGCVIIEANAVGIPVIVSELPVFHELIIENQNGHFVEANNSNALADKLIEFSKSKNSFDKNQIVESTGKYGFDNVATQFDKLYRQLFSENSF